jgi:hypothetical protein
MSDKEPLVSWQMLAIIGAVFAYTGWGALQLGAVEEQVRSTTKEIGEAKLATAQLAAQALQEQQELATANTVLRERVTRLETMVGE